MITTSKKINLEQLDKELGNQGLCADFNDENKKVIKVAENSTVTAEELQLAIDNHVAKPTQAEITKLNKEQAIAKLKDLGFTSEQITALIA